MFKILSNANGNTKPKEKTDIVKNRVSNSKSIGSLLRNTVSENLDDPAFLWTLLHKRGKS